MTCGAPFLLVGIDADGDTREIECSSLTKAVELARRASVTDSDGPAWKSWEVYGNDPLTEEWKPLKYFRP